MRHWKPNKTFMTPSELHTLRRFLSLFSRRSQDILLGKKKGHRRQLQHILVHRRSHFTRFFFNTAFTRTNNEKSHPEARVSPWSHSRQRRAATEAVFFLNTHDTHAQPKTTRTNNSGSHVHWHCADRQGPRSGLWFGAWQEIMITSSSLHQKYVEREARKWIPH